MNTRHPAAPVGGTQPASMTYHAPSPAMHDRSTPSPRTLRTDVLRLATIVVATTALVLTLVPAATAAPVVAAPAIVPFEQWAPAACPQPTGEDPAAVRRLVVHHTHEPVAHTPQEVPTALALTCKAHTDRGFSTIGYHYVVDPWGQIYQGRGGLPDDKGRAPATQAQGAHVAGTNAGAVGVVFLGDHEDEPPTAAALAAATHLLAWLIEDTGSDPDELVPTNSSGVGTARYTGTFTPKALSGHSTSNHTACPGAHLGALLPAMRNRMRDHLAGEPVASWDGLAAPAAPVEAAPAEAAPAPAPEPAPNKPAAAQTDDATSLLPATLAPLISPVERVAGTLRDMGLLSLAERLAGNGTG